MWWIAFVIACGSQEPTLETATDASAPDVPTVVLPEIDVEVPARAAFLPAGPGEVRGRAIAGTHPLSRLELNGEPIEMADDGSFVHSVDWPAGLTVLELRVEDAGGERAVHAQGVYAGAEHAPGTRLTDAVLLELDAEMIDDGDRSDLDDAATIVHKVITDPELSRMFLGTDIEADYFTITPTGFSFVDADVDLQLRTGRVDVAITLQDVWLDFDVSGHGWYSWVSTSGSAWVESTRLSLQFDVGTQNRNATVSVSSSDVRLDGYGLTVDWFPDGMEDDLADWTQEGIENDIASSAETLFQEQFAGFIDAFAVETTFGDGIELSLQLAGLDVVSSAIRLTMDATVTARSNISLPSGAGSLATAGSKPRWPLGNGSGFSVAADDDFVNQLLFAYWASGALDQQTFTAADMKDLSSSDLPPPLGPVSEVTISLQLPPVVSLASRSDQDVDLGVGELRLAFLREDGEILDFSINVRTGAVVELGDTGELMLSLDNRPANMDVGVDVLQSPRAIDPGDLAALVRLMVPPLLGSADEFLPGFPAPTIDLGALTDVGALQGVELGLSEPDVTISESGWMLLSGALVPQ